MTRPDYVSEELWERARVAWTEASLRSMHDAVPFGQHAIALALLQARNEGLREAAKVADDGGRELFVAANYDPEGTGETGGWYQGGMHEAERISKSILSLIQEPS